VIAVEITVNVVGGYGRRIAITPTAYLQICRAYALGAHARSAAAAAGISQGCLETWRRRGRKYAAMLHTHGLDVPDAPPLSMVEDWAANGDEYPLELRKRGDTIHWFLELHCQQAEGLAQARALESIHAAAARGDWRASSWMLERRWPREWGKEARVQDLSEEDIESLDGMTDEELASQMAEMQKRLAVETSARTAKPANADEHGG